MIEGIILGKKCNFSTPAALHQRFDKNFKTFISKNNEYCFEVN
jgi:hypothetical protein